MKKLLIAAGIILLLFFSGSFFQNKKTKEDVLHYKLNSMMYRLYVADSPQERERGLMGIKNIRDAHGMIFLFPDKKERGFWNEDTHFDLDVYWLDGDTIVGKSYLPSIEKSKEVVIIQSPQPVNKVIELIR